MEQLVKKPIITEKSLQLAGRGVYTFAVDTMARKGEIAREVATLFGVHVIGVRTRMAHGKMRKAGRSGRLMQKPDWKRAMVYVAPGEKIDIFEVISQPQEVPPEQVKEAKTEVQKEEKDVKKTKSKKA